MATSDKFIRSAELAELKGSIEEYLDTVTNLLDTGFEEDAYALVERFANEVLHMTVCEPGLRYWMHKPEGSFPKVWASTDDAASLDPFNHTKEISMEAYQELRNQEWAQLSAPAGGAFDKS